MIKIEGLDRLSAYELKELAEASGEHSGQVIIESDPPTGTHAGDLGTVTAIITEFGPHLALLLAAWVAAKKGFEFELTRETAEGEKKSLKIKYEQEGLTSLIKTIKEFLA